MSAGGGAAEMAAPPPTGDPPKWEFSVADIAGSPCALAKPPQKAIGRHLGNPALTLRARAQVLVHRFSRGVIKLAQTVGLQSRIIRVDGGRGAHGRISGGVTTSTSIAQSLIKKGRNCARPAAKKPI